MFAVGAQIVPGEHAERRRRIETRGVLHVEFIRPVAERA
jgi:hypothetical protein